MKNRAAVFLKQIICTLKGMAKAKMVELKRKARTFQTRLVIFSLLHNTSLSHDKLKGLMGYELNSQVEERRKGKPTGLCNAVTSSSNPVEEYNNMEKEEDQEWRHSDLVIEDKEEEFQLEDEIDRVADLFIRRFHRQMWLQKQLSFESPRSKPDETPPPAP